MSLILLSLHIIVGRVKWSCAVVVGVPQGIVGNTIALLSRACIRVRARAFQQRCCFFLLSQVSHTEKKLVEKRQFWELLKRKNALFHYLLQHIFLD